ncbi:MAG: hypothetical protein SP1CHLAM54_09500 [Chlamydiia bacterium]|nr:hypothetical protein [Chlamydiia bacterium]MCH9615856.1 hypothetical protein [Chlamydiia bacterium]MCH9628741.1 hypothetical protein [Chlamydiia bacterium]
MRFIILLGAMTCLWGRHQHSSDPIFSGTLLSEYSRNTPPGKVEVEPFLFLKGLYGAYDASWKKVDRKTEFAVQWLQEIEVGISRHFDFTLMMNAFVSWIGGQKSVRWGDMQTWLGIQVYEDKKGSWMPDVRVIVGEKWPTGRHDRLDPDKLQADASGSGAFETVLMGVLGKIWRPSWSRPWKSTVNVWYFFPMKTTIHGSSIYGGVPGGRSVVRPGKFYGADLGLEYSLIGNWELIGDLRYEHEDATVVLSGVKKGVGEGSSEQFSFAPGFAYNFDDSFSVYAGVWWSLAGRNAEAFASGVFTVYKEF